VTHKSIRRGVVTLAFALVAFACLNGGFAAAAEPDTTTFEYSGEPQLYAVPAGVTEISILALGGAGAAGNSNFAGAPGGAGGATSGRFAVTPGELLTVWVGEEGQALTGAGGVSRGYGCGGSGGAGDKEADGGGGGGASAVLRGEFISGDVPCEPLPEGAEAAALVVAGGGGGGGEGSISLEHSFSGSAGGDGGEPAGVGHENPKVKGAGGCGGCEPGPAGAAGEAGGVIDGGAGGGGGGYRGGGGGRTGPTGGAGGGGGRSFLSPAALDSEYLPGHGTGNGVVVISTRPTEVFGCTGAPQTAIVPAGVGQMKVEAIGADGGGTPGTEVAGGAGGIATGTFEVEPGEEIEVQVGCTPRGRSGGYGFGTGGSGGEKSLSGQDGFGGGGSSAVQDEEALLILAAGGGGAGGHGESNEFLAGGGGAGGESPEPGAPGGDGAHGGQGGAVAGTTGGNGEAGTTGTFEGGGGGGGSGWSSGEGGRSGHPEDGAGGGGGGLSHIAVTARDASFGTSSLSGSGTVTLTFLPGVPRVVGTYGGSKQSTIIGSAFARPLQALVTDAGGDPVAGAVVAFSVPTAGATGTFAGGRTVDEVQTDAEGVATSSTLTADDVGGTWAARASVQGVAGPATFALQDAPASTAVSVVPSAEFVTATEPVTFTATVSATVGTPTGSVQFYDGETKIGAPVQLSGGSATSEAMSGLPAGFDEIEARYEGTPTYLASTGKGRVTVRKGAISVALSGSPNPAAPGESVTFTATVTGPGGNTAYDGPVQFKVDGGPLGTPVTAVGGVAVSPPWEALVSGLHTIVAEAAESGSFEAGFGQMRENVDPDGAAIELTSTANPVEFGSPVTFEATVVPRPPKIETPTGELDIVSQGTDLGCVLQLSGGKASCEVDGELEPGIHVIEAEWGGDLNYGPSEGTLVELVLKAQTAATLAPSRPTAVYGEEVSLEAEMGRSTAGTGVPSGAVEFTLDGAAVGGPATLAAGKATSNSLLPSAGAHVVAVTYDGDTDFTAGGTSIPYVVAPAATSVSLIADPESSSSGEGVSFAATVTPQRLPDGAAAPTPTGRIQFHVDGLDLGAPVPLTDGSAVSPLDESMAPGSHDIVATYLPADPDFTASYASITHVVQQPSTTVLATSANPVVAGTPITLHAHVGPAAGEGTIAFAVDGAEVASCRSQPLREGEATCALAGLGGGEHEMSATFSGSRLLEPSRGAMTQTVDAVGGESLAEAPTGAGGPSPSPPPPACQARSLRTQATVFGSRDAVRLLARYVTAAPAKATVGLFIRGAGGKSGRHLATLTHSWKKSGRAEIERRLPARTIAQLRRGHGFVVRISVPAAAGFCAESLDRQLNAPRKAGRRTVWHERAAR
jgi:Bacterial Ig-like domain (group 3)